MPTPEFLTGYYASYHQQRAEGVTFTGPRRFARHLGRWVELPDEEPLTILDLGGGSGALAGAIVERWRGTQTARTAVVDVVDHGAPGESRAGGTLIRRRASLEEAGGGYHLVLASAVLEHVPELGLVLKGLLDRVAPGGWFYARTAYNLPLARLLPGLDFTFPAHVHDLGFRFWDGVATLFGFPADRCYSRPALTATSLPRAPVRTLVAWLAKLPAHLETPLTRTLRTRRRWGLVSGWEVFLRRAR
jgi:SAM-dependent methyltransferase